MPERFTLTSEPESLAPMRAWLRATFDRARVPVAEADLLVVAVGEVCMNVIQHAYVGERGQPIRLSVDAGADRLLIEIEDFGRAFEAESAATPAAEAGRDAGYGLTIIRAVVDELAIDVDRPRGTRWTLIKHLRHHGREPA